MNIADVLALSKAGFTPEQITALAPVLGREAEPAPEPTPAPEPAPAPVPEPAPAPSTDEMPAWADKLINTLQAVALTTAQNPPMKTPEELANDALAQIINPTHNGGAK